MHKIILIRFVPPAPVKTLLGKGASHTREWNGDKLVATVQEGLELWAAEYDPELEVRVILSRQAEIRFEGTWKPDREMASDLRQRIGETMSYVLEGIEAEEYLSD
ncbi:hypothetical protein [Deinococcus sp.]|uniref:hypothetical protein n=1 Tax=Deinococcus sp. TaxID=47478 RepID=UPI003B5A77F0